MLKNMTISFQSGFGLISLSLQVHLDDLMFFVLHKVYDRERERIIRMSMYTSMTAKAHKSNDSNRGRTPPAISQKLY